MTKGRNTSVISIRLPDDQVKALKVIARRRYKTVSEIVKPAIASIVYEARQRSRKVKKAYGGIEEPPDLELEPNYWNEPKPKFEASPSPGKRIKARAKRKTKRKRR